MVWLLLVVSEKASPGAGPCHFSSPVRASAPSLHLSSWAPVPEADTPAVAQESQAGEAALEILVVPITLARVFQALSLLLEKRNGLVPHTGFHLVFFFYFLATAAEALIKG